MEVAPHSIISKLILNAVALSALAAIFSSCAPVIVTRATQAADFTANVAQAVVAACADNSQADQAQAQALANAASNAASALQSASENYQDASERTNVTTQQRAEDQVTYWRNKINQLNAERQNIVKHDVDRGDIGDPAGTGLNAEDAFFRSGAGGSELLREVKRRAEAARRRALDAAAKVAASSSATQTEKDDAIQKAGLADQAARTAEEKHDQAIAGGGEWDPALAKEAVIALWDAESYAIDAELVQAQVNLKKAEEDAQAATKSAREAVPAREQAQANVEAAMTAAAQAAARAYNQLKQCGGVPPTVPNIPGYDEAFWDISSP